MFGKSDAEIRAEAAAWVARLQSDARTDADATAWQAWMAGDPRRREAFARVTQAWEAAGALSARPASAPWPGRRAVLIGGATAVLAAGGALAVRDQPQRYATGVGELRRVVLADGSSMLLDTQTEVSVRLRKRERQV